MNQIVSKAEKFQSVEKHFVSNIAKYRKQLACHVDPERLVSVALTSIRKNPKLLECTEKSLFGAILEAGRYGLYTDDAVGQAYLVPFRDNKKGVTEVTFMVGYKGWIQLCRNSNELSIIYAEVVYEKDEFEWELGLNPVLRHKPSSLPVKDRGNITHAYAVAHLKDGGKQFKVLTKEEVDAVRAMSKSKDSPAWKYHYGEMAKKSCIIRLAKYLPMSTEAERLRTRDEMLDAGLEPGIEETDFEVKSTSTLDEVADAFAGSNAEPDGKVTDLHRTAARMRLYPAKKMEELTDEERDNVEYEAHQVAQEEAENRAQKQPA